MFVQPNLTNFLLDAKHAILIQFIPLWYMTYMLSYTMKTSVIDVYCDQRVFATFSWNERSHLKPSPIKYGLLGNHKVNVIWTDI